MSPQAVPPVDPTCPRLLLWGLSPTRRGQWAVTRFCYFEILLDFPKLPKCPKNSCHTHSPSWLAATFAFSFSLPLLFFWPKRECFQTWCPSTLEHFGVYFLKNRELLTKQYNYQKQEVTMIQYRCLIIDLALLQLTSLGEKKLSVVSPDPGSCVISLISFHGISSCFAWPSHF